MAAATQTALTEDFAALLDESFGPAGAFEGSVVKGLVVAVDGVAALELLCAAQAIALQLADIKAGDFVEVFVERYEDKNGEVMLSREKARREEAWTQLERAFQENQRVNGVIFGRVKGGFTVDLAGAVAFLPGSQVDVRPVRDVGPLMGSPQPFQILKMDRSRGNIVVSRRAVLEETRAEPAGEPDRRRCRQEHHRLRRIR